MRKKILFVILFVARYTGIFALSRVLTAGDLRILCYHGGALHDEHRFRSGLFMTEAVFARRMKFLDDADYPVLPLGEAIERLEHGTLPRSATVITIDDGWYGTYKHQVPVLQRHGFPATVYIASYYLDRQTQVFNVAVSYVLWRSGAQQIDLTKLGIELEGGKDIRAVSDDLVTALCDAADALDGAEARQALLREICEAVGFDWREMEAQRLVSFMSVDEARDASENGIDIQLHTHRHRFPDNDFEAARAEIEDNRRSLKSVAQSDLRHFCYPSGVYSTTSVAFLRDLDILSATTTDPGFNRRGAPRLELTRFLDADTVTDLEFAAEMSGFYELIRRTGYRI